MKKRSTLILLSFFVVGFSFAAFIHLARSEQGDIVFHGNAWSAYKTQDGAVHGVGWIAFSDQGTGSSVPIKVYANGTGELRGAAWASIDNPNTPEIEQNYGWLSFEPDDTKNCPEGNTGLCTPKLNRGTGEISGWARFICVDGNCKSEKITENTWDGWVKLRNSPNESVKYGVCFGNSSQVAVPIDGKTYFTGEQCKKDGDPSNAVLTGMMWGGPVVGGWFVFTNEAPSGLLSITPSFSRRLAIFEKADYSANQAVKWLVGASPTAGTIGGNSVLGTVMPTSTDAGTKTTYTAPNTAQKVYLIAENAGGTKASVEIESTAPYRLNTCSTNSSTSLNIDWTALYHTPSYAAVGEYPSYAPHKVELFSGTSSSSISKKLGSFDPGSRIFTHTNLSTSTPYYYQLKITYPYFNGFSTTTPILGPCTVVLGPQGDDTPSRTRAFALSNTSILVNWKDNTTTTSPYKFEIQRIKVTPASSTQFVATSTSASSVRFTWNNITTSTPYYHELERSTTTESYRFNRNAQIGTLDPTLKVIDVNGWNQTYLPTQPQYVDFTDSSVNEATTYYYRVRTCSTIDLSKAYNTDVLRGGTEKPNPACSKYAISIGRDKVGDFVITTTTPPYAPTNATSSASWDGTTHTITLQWKDNSKRETGYRIFRNGVLIENNLWVSPEGVAAGLVSYTDSSNELESGTYYKYEIQAFYNYTSDLGKGTVYSEKAITGTYTYFKVDLSMNPSDGGTIAGPEGNCPGVCTQYFPWGTYVSFTAAENAGYDFDSWSGYPCNGSGNYVCSFKGDVGDRSLTAHFAQQVFSLSVSVSGTGTVSGSGISCPPACSASVPWGTAVSLSASPTSTFTGWGGACSGTSTRCSFTMYEDRNVTANFSGLGMMNSVRNLFARLFGNAENSSRVIVDSNANGQANMFNALSSKIKGFFETMKYILTGMRDEFSNTVTRIEKAAEQYIIESARTAEGRQYAPTQLDAYFETFTASSTIPSYEDKNLDPDTVYMYRVRVKYSSGKTSRWDLPGAAKTLSDTQGLPTTNHGVCVQNSYCDLTIKSYTSTKDPSRDPKAEESEEQCTTNSQCRDVGRGGQRYEER